MGTQGQRCALLDRPLTATRKTPDSEVRYRMREQFACPVVKVTKVGDQMFRSRWLQPSTHVVVRRASGQRGSGLRVRSNRSLARKIRN